MNFVVRKVGEVREVLNFVVGVVWEGKKVREVKFGWLGWF